MPVWRTREDAIEYLQIDNGKEAFDFFSVYWGTAKDVHPPLFYFAVHIVSILFWGHFSKYIIFIVNLIFFIGTCIILRKIFIKLNRKNLSIPNLILYGLSVRSDFNCYVSKNVYDANIFYGLVLILKFKNLL